VIGLGYVGLPVGVSFARSGVPVGWHLDQRFQDSNHIGLSEFQHLAAQTGEAELSGFMESVV
jgi:UDP-N-acetyl-D-mannosaminuronate dehydrogenase